MARSLKNLPELAAAAGLNLAGVAPASPPADLYTRLQRRLIEGRVTPFEEKDPAIRLAPEKLLPGCRNIVVVGMPYAPRSGSSPGRKGPAGRSSPLCQGARLPPALKDPR